MFIDFINRHWPSSTQKMENKRELSSGSEVDKMSFLKVDTSIGNEVEKKACLSPHISDKENSSKPENTTVLISPKLKNIEIETNSDKHKAESSTPLSQEKSLLSPSSRSSDNEIIEKVGTVEVSQKDSEINTTSPTCNDQSNNLKTPENTKQKRENRNSARRLDPAEKKRREDERLAEKKRREEEKEAEKLRKIREREQEKLKRDQEKQRKEAELKAEKQRKEAEIKAEKLRKEAEIKAEKVRKEAEREAEKIKKEAEKEAERLKREEAIKKKEEEKKAKEEERKAKEDEKKKKIEEEERKKKAQANFLAKFLGNSPSGNSDEKNKKRQLEDGSLPDPKRKAEGNSTCTEIQLIDISSSETEASKIVPSFRPMPFQVKNGMALAPLLRRPKLTPQEKENIDKYFNMNSSDKNSDTENLLDNSDIEMVQDKNYENSISYIKEIRVMRKGKGRKFKRTEIEKPMSETDIEILVIDSPRESGLVKWRWKLLQFTDNRRPPYWGTYKKQPRHVTARRPFAQEEEMDYEFDSDDEWEDEPEDGEELGDKDDEDKEEDEKEKGNGGDEEEEEEDDDDKFIVPHGYLSDSEGENEEKDRTDKSCFEEQYLRDLKGGLRHVGLMTIETEYLSHYRMIFHP